MSGEIIGRFFKLKGEIDPKEAIDISNHASLAFLQKHLSKYLFTSKHEIKLREGFTRTEHTSMLFGTLAFNIALEKLIYRKQKVMLFLAISVSNSEVLLLPSSYVLCHFSLLKSSMPPPLCQVA